MKRTSIFLLLAVLSSGCVYESQHEAVLCDSVDECGEGATCLDGICVADAEAAPDAGADMEEPEPDAGAPDASEPDMSEPEFEIDSIVVEPATTSVGIGAQVQLTATAFDTDGETVADVPLSWASGAEALATVDATGLVTGVDLGTVQIRASYGNVAASALVEVLPALDSIQITPLSPTVKRGRSLQLTARAIDAGGNVVEGREFDWVSASPGVATVDPISGSVIGIMVGRTDVTASTGGLDATVEVEVLPNPVSTVEITPRTAQVEQGSTQLYTVVLRDAENEVLALDGRDYEWDSSIDSVASLSDPPGLPESIRLTGNQLGTTELKVVVDQDATDTLDIEIVERPIMSVTIDPLTEKVPVGSTRQLTTEVLDFSGTPIVGRDHVWSSDDEGVIEILDAQAGTIRALQPGTATVSVDVDGNTATLQVDAYFGLKTIDAGYTHACGLSVDGVAFCWGKDDQDQLGDPAASGSSATPLFVVGDHVFVAIAAGDGFSCALDTSGAAYCWGRASAIGGTASNVPTLLDPTLTFKAIDSFYRHSCGVTSGGEIYCWGKGANGELGDGNSNDSDTPVKVDFNPAPTGTPTSVAVGFGHSCALTDMGETYCWGNGFGGALGTGNETSKPRPALVTVPALEQVTAGNSFTCGRTAADVVYCWGTNAVGQLGVGDQTSEKSTTPVMLPNTSLTDISAGSSHACGIRSADAVVVCWGQGDDLRLGNGAAADQYAPVPNSQSLTAQDVSAGETFACLVDSDGQPYCWGDNADGRAGTSALDPVDPPALVWPTP